jgi:hypothetical protein
MKDKILRNIGILIVLGGILLLLNSLSAVPIIIAASVRAAIFLAAGAACMIQYMKNRSSSWLAAGLVSIAIAASQALGFFGLEKFISTAAIGLLGIGFLLLTGTMPTLYWWGVVPGMLLLSFAVVDLLPTFGVTNDTSGLPLIGLGLAFLILLFQPVGRPTGLALTLTALVMVFIGAYPLFSPGASIQGLVLPAILLVGGVLLLGSGVKRR